MENQVFSNKYQYYDWHNIPSGTNGAIARYSVFNNSVYNNNPLTETLPPIFKTAQVIQLMRRLPNYHEKLRELDSEERFPMITQLGRYFDPLPMSLHLHQMIDTIIRDGYIDRNPLNPECAARARQIYREVQQKDGKELEKSILEAFGNANAEAPASGISIIGESGTGKSCHLTNILRLYPQVYLHPEYNITQLLWLKVDCPHKEQGSLKELCRSIFRQVDRLLNTTFHEDYGSDRNSEGRMLGQLEEIAWNFYLGVLVIDEIQNLTLSPKNRNALLNFLVKMDNVLGIPVIRIGTNDAQSILTKKLSIGRRSTGEGAIRWKRLPQKKHWKRFIKEMWKYQWTKTETPLTDEIEEVLYYETQGFIDLAIKLYKMVQWKVLAQRGEEIITVELIREAAEEGLFLVKDILAAVRSGNQEKINKYRDIAVIDDEGYMQKYNELMYEKIYEEREKEPLPQLNIDEKLQVQVNLNLCKLGLKGIDANKMAQQIIQQNPQEKDADKLTEEANKMYLELMLSDEPVLPSQVEKATSSNMKKTPHYIENDLRMILKEANEQSVAVDELLEKAGIIPENPYTKYLGTHDAVSVADSLS